MTGELGAKARKQKAESAKARKREIFINYPPSPYKSLHVLIQNSHKSPQV